MASSAFFFYLLHHVQQPTSTSSLFCTIFLLLLALAPSPSHTQTFPLTNPHLFHTSQLSYVFSKAGTEHHTPASSSSSAIPQLASDETVLTDSGENLVLEDNVAQEEHALLVDDGARKEEFSTAMTRPYIHQAVEASLVSSSGTHLLRDNARREEHGSLRYDGRREKKTSPGLTITAHKAQRIHGRDREGQDGHNNVVPLDNREPLEGNVPEEDNNAFLVDDGVKHSRRVNTDEDGSLLRDSRQQGEFSYLLSDGSTKRNGAAAENHVEEKRPASDHGMESALRTSAGDAADNKMVQNGGDDQSPRLGNSMRRGPAAQTGGGAAGRSRTCTSNPHVCQHVFTADAELQIDQFISLYGHQQAAQRPTKRQAACCSGACVDVLTHVSNCGSCGKQCGLSQTCCNGRCTDLNTDSSNCGRCGNSCPAASPCQYGMCGYY